MDILLEKERQYKNKDLTISNLCEILSISEATVKNWIKLNKITPTYIDGSTVYFSKDYVRSLVDNIHSESSELLKSRRNKKYVSGSFLYRDYISASSENIPIISELLNCVESEKLQLTEAEIKYLVADCAIKLLLQRQQLSSDSINNHFYEYLTGTLSLNKFDRLIADLIESKNGALNFINNFPKLFNKQYFYEQNEDILGLLYISLSNIGERKAKGSYYTPTNVVQKIVNNIDFTNIQDKKILDPSCGSGNFLLQLPKTLSIKHIYGNDIDNNAIQIARLNMALNFEIPDIDVLYTNFTNKDFLIDNFDLNFDYILGNPPWGAEFSKDAIAHLKSMCVVTDNKNVESYDVFIEKSLNCLNKGGYLSFVLPEALLSVKTHTAIRKYIMENNSIMYLEFLGNIFDKVQCPSVILQLKHTMSLFSTVGMKVVIKNRDFEINTDRVVTPDVFSFFLDDEEYLVYKKITDRKNKLYLKNNAIFALGLVTGDNKKHLSHVKTESNETILKGSDIRKYKIGKPTSYIEYTPQKFQQVAPTEYYRAKEKLFYKFISNKLVFAYDNLQTLSLNSCNILIPQLNGYDIKYIMAILNSDVAQFIFEKKYNSVKVLRSHIEEIPIPICNKKKQSEVVKIVDSILTGEKDDYKQYELLENMISELFELTNEEQEVIKSSLNEKYIKKP